MRAHTLTVPATRSTAPRSLADGIWRTLATHPGRPALQVGETEWCYADLARRAGGIARTLLDHDDHDVVGVFGCRSVTGYAGVLACALAGRGFVPLHPAHPAARTREMVAAARLRSIIAAREALPQLTALAQAVPETLTIICPDGLDRDVVRALPQHRWVPSADAVDPEPVANVASSPAYVLFTSGSTGMPKGVCISQRNVVSYLDYMVPASDTQPDDRCSQWFEPTFDLSVHDLFVTWWAGACLCAMPSRSVMAPGPQIIRQRLTQWFSVPSVVGLMERLGQLKAGAYPGLRRARFCGEALQAEQVVAWRRAAPAAQVDNLYGPTEATIAIAAYRWDDQHSPAACRDGIVPLGRVFPTQRETIVAEDGGPGELWLAGSQVANGYLHDPVRTAEQFVVRPEMPDLLWYRTGDRVERVDGLLHYRGRRDDQVQVQGHRVELQDIEHALRQVAGTPDVAVVFQERPGSAGELVGFVAAAVDGDVQAIRAALAERLPAYMIPRRFRFESLPLSPHGKLDRPALVARLEDDHAGDC